MNIDFSDLNLQYLIQARDLARQDPHLAGVLLGIPSEMAGMVGNLSPRTLAQITQIKIPLITPQQETGWWLRLLTALKDEDQNEIGAIMAQAPLIVGASYKVELA
ncbi:flagellar transcriptional regulator FlhD [Sedimenticola selenatireducens]|uniref:flagellar transcriptional regulator FlhD n=1 Tax=Sedimenticola selenatireducens TaxID=191960 RepID=UPI00048F75D2|nr:flagellar transcriptional regulator FlhD [Sedimenticola selenatireducens]